MDLLTRHGHPFHPGDQPCHPFGSSSGWLGVDEDYLVDIETRINLLLPGPAWTIGHKVNKDTSHPTQGHPRWAEKRQVAQFYRMMSPWFCLCLSNPTGENCNPAFPMLSRTLVQSGTSSRERSCGQLSLGGEWVKNLKMKLQSAVAGLKNNCWWKPVYPALSCTLFSFTQMIYLYDCITNKIVHIVWVPFLIHFPKKARPPPQSV